MIESIQEIDVGQIVGVPIGEMPKVDFTIVTSIKQLKVYVKKAGIKVYAVASLTRDDEMCIEVKKSHFLEVMDRWSSDALTAKNSKVIIDKDGDVIYG